MSVEKMTPIIVQCPDCMEYSTIYSDELISLDSLIPLVICDICNRDNKLIEICQ